MAGGESVWEAPDGTRLPVAEWIPSGRCRGVLLCVHGLGGAPGDFEPVGERMSAGGFPVVALTVRGQGLDPDPRRRGHQMEPSVIGRDLVGLMEDGMARYSGLPVYFLGESLGALLVANALVRERKLRERVRGVIFSAPVVALARENPRLVKVLLRAIAGMAPRLRFRHSWFVTGKGRAPQVSRDPEWVERQKSGPQYIPAFTVNMLSRVGELIDSSERMAEAVTVPSLVLAAGRDVFVRVEQVEGWYRRLASPDKMLNVYPDAYHVLWNDWDRERVLADMEDWLCQRL